MYPFYDEVGQERFDLGFGGEEMLTGPHAVETNKPHDPVHVGSPGANGVVVQTEYLSDLIEEFWLLTHSEAPSPAFQGGIKKRRSGSTPSKPWPSGWVFEGLTFCRVRHIKLL
jgi:hypothetical protein